MQDNQLAARLVILTDIMDDWMINHKSNFKYGAKIVYRKLSEHVHDLAKLSYLAPDIDSFDEVRFEVMEAIEKVLKKYEKDLEVTE